MSNKGALAAFASGVLVALCSAGVAEAAQPVTVFLERNGRVIDHEGEEVAIPKFGGGDAAWNGIVGCVKKHFDPFQIEVVDSQPRGAHITALIGGRASQLGLDDRSTNGVGPYIPGRIQRNALVHVFSKVGTGERDINNLCAVTVHEIGHALGLDHTHKCGDIMSYYLDRCGPRKLMDVDAPCGEFSARACGDGSRSQNSYRMIADLVGLKNQPEPEPEPEHDHDHDHDADHDDSGDTDDSDHRVDPWAGDDEQQEQPRRRGRRWNQEEPAQKQPKRQPQLEPEEQEESTEDEPEAVQYVEDRYGNRYTMQRVQGRNGRTYIILRRVR